MGRAGERGVGETVLAAVQATRRWTAANTNLGIVLLFAPIAHAAHKSQDSSHKTQAGVHTEASRSPNRLRITHYVLRPPALRDSLRQVLHSLTLEDAVAAYAAIRLAVPGGLGDRVEKHDIREEPAVTLHEAMRAAAGRDSVASEYVTDYAITFEKGLPALQGALERGLAASALVVQTYLELLAAVPDTLIARKQGRAVAEQVSRGAAQVLQAGGMASDEGRQAIAAFDADLRDPANSLNPGTTADLTAAVLFVALLTGMMV
jgi:triphosphoribosyl-dephospho-CoA synthase